MKKIIHIILLLLYFAVTSQAQGNKSTPNDTILNLSDDEFKELEQKLVSEDPSFRFKFLSENDISFFLAAQKRRPQNFIWIDLINLHFAGERFNARQLENEGERKILFGNALQYLTESLNTLENASLTDVTDTIQLEYNLILRKLKENIAIAAVGTGELDKAKQMAQDLLINNHY